ncbi:outer membrane protein [Aminobacter sp. BA135]|uniref:outer membrane protein n=1 Tax=Aminobacter sp. BA135 TaxID=537596 RepID=UPI003D7B27B7
MKLITANTVCGTSPAILLAASLSFAGTLPEAASDTFASAPAGFVWTGGYVGVQAGYSWADATVVYEDTIDGGIADGYAALAPRGAMGGFYAGYGHQLANDVVLGVETDLQFGSASSSAQGRLRSGGEDADFRYTSKLDWSASLRVRLGYGAGRFQPYVSAGVTVAEFDFSRTTVFPYLPISLSNTHAGWTIGAGLEYAATDNLVLRTEYRYTDFGSQDLDLLSNGLRPTATLRTHDVRLGLAYKF